MTQERFTYLIHQYASNELDAAGLEDLLTALQQHDYIEPLQNAIEAALQNEMYKGLPDAGRADIIFEKIKKLIPREEGTEKVKGNKQLATGKVRKLWKRWVVAASILLVVGLGTAALVFTNKSRHSELVSAPFPKDVPAPSSNRAMITLANGQVVYLDSVANGTLATQNNVQLIKTADGKIIYDGSQLVTQNLQLSYNTLTNPRGSKVIDMQLADGSHVWLNAGSSVTYPVAFIANERKVSITGEAYFEVAHDAAKPFFVTKGDVSVQVLGTHFNVNAYDDENDIKVTLLEGSVQVASPSPSGEGFRVRLKPGEQAVSNSHSPFTIDHSPDIEQVMAWKNGRFELNGSTIEPIMRQIARWYDVDIEYQGAKPTDNFMGGTSRQENVSELLKILEQTNAVKFTIEGRKIIVSK